MKLKKSTILELGTIIKENYGKELNYSDLEKLAYSLVGLYDLLAKLHVRKKKREDHNQG